MGDLTKGSITGHLLTMGAFSAVTMLVQTAYFIVDLYFVSQLGKEAIAGVSAAGNITFLGMGISQIIGVGVMSLVSRAIGAGDHAHANLLFNQGLGMGIAIAAVAMAIGYGFGFGAVDQLVADEASSVQAHAYLAAYLPSLALTFPMMALGGALRAAGIVKWPTLVSTASLGVNIVLAPVLIAGWGTGVPLGVAGAGWASSIAVMFAIVFTLVIFPRAQTAMRWQYDALKPRLSEWMRLLTVGLPAAAEFLLMFVFMAVIYYVIRDFGAAAQAGFGIGGRVLQSVMLPAMAIAFSAAPIVGQNLGAKQPARVRETFYRAATISAGLMLALALLMHVSPSALTYPFSPDPAVLANANLYLQIISWNMIATGVVFTCSGVLQGLGNTLPALFSSMSRILTFVAPALWLHQQPGVQIEQFWWLSVTASLVQAVFSLWLVMRELQRKTGSMIGHAVAVTASTGPAPQGPDRS